MSELINSLLSCADFGLTSENIHCLNNNSFIVTKWDWDYSQAHMFQKFSLKIVQENPAVKILIFCSHPEVLTYGRGLQKPRKGEILDLVEFEPEQIKNHSYPLYKIERGGGLTFHHPGQFIFYPIIKLNPKTLSLSLMINQIFEFTTKVLNDWGIQELNHQNKLLGLWRGEKKIASMGIAIDKLTTYHGMALNIFNNQNMLDALQSLNPCGLKIQTYTSVEHFINLPLNPLESFKKEFLKRIEHEWK
jgi:lipoyl(octanoyl) transferase